ncbi:HEAT repeat domain-containing protein, partial [Streptomyces sp. T-3]|nr:HEAT repeat domain-containing protein [Streptomyces sp. T-3]
GEQWAAGRRVLGALVGIAGGPVSERRSAALRALTVSCRQEAAQALARLSDDEARRALQEMGDVAVPALATEAQRRRHLWAVRSLGAIGTPAAADSLYRLVWDADDLAARCAAWQLASLLRNAEVRNELIAQEVPDSAVAGYAWIDDAFQPKELGPLAGRVAWLMDGGRMADESPSDQHPAFRFEDDEATVGVVAVHPLLGIPLFACARLPQLPPPRTLEWDRLDALFDRAAGRLGTRLRQRITSPRQSEAQVAVATLFSDDYVASEDGASVLASLKDEVLRTLDVPGIRRTALQALPQPVQVRLMDVRFGTHAYLTVQALQAKWRRVHTETDPPHFFNRLAGGIGILLAAYFLVQGGARLLATTGWFHAGGQSGWGAQWLAFAAVGAMVLGGVAAYILTKVPENIEDPFGYTMVVLWGLSVAYLIVLATVSAAEQIGWHWTVAGYGLLTATVVLCIIIAERINERRNNPLRAVLQAA